MDENHLNIPMKEEEEHLHDPPSYSRIPEHCPHCGDSLQAGLETAAGIQYYCSNYTRSLSPEYFACSAGGRGQSGITIWTLKSRPDIINELHLVLDDYVIDLWEGKTIIGKYGKGDAGWRKSLTLPYETSISFFPFNKEQVLNQIKMFLIFQ